MLIGSNDEHDSDRLVLLPLISFNLLLWIQGSYNFPTSSLCLELAVSLLEKCHHPTGATSLRQESAMPLFLLCRLERSVTELTSHKTGCEVYLVGGCVRDLILTQIPKNFDVITLAELRQVVNTFSCCEIVGRGFPTGHVHVDDTFIEERDFIIWRNCMKRDFTINGLMLDPYANVVYDYVGGMEDYKKLKRIVISANRLPPNVSILISKARFLQAIRIAACLGLRLTKETTFALKDLYCSVPRLDKAPHGNELHAGVWICRSLFKATLEGWAPGDTTAVITCQAGLIFDCLACTFCTQIIVSYNF
ncbi:hypothetical protein MKW98_029775 [Papaver atlanticum]|uniref:Poly A polymerase head domain-containing protein n=1 Tax=Papaver atlanticum TaxID=357466 RepID=A0AAD4XSL5_9MAGN|nr:hypothetical protein MKW98_029775 [Papaver atlanticum]